MVTTAEEIFRKGTIEQQADLLCDIFLMNDVLTCEECPAALFRIHRLVKERALVPREGGT